MIKGAEEAEEGAPNCLKQEGHFKEEVALKEAESKK